MVTLSVLQLVLVCIGVLAVGFFLIKAAEYLYSVERIAQKHVELWAQKVWGDLEKRINAIIGSWYEEVQKWWAGEKGRIDLLEQRIVRLEKAAGLGVQKVEGIPGNIGLAASSIVQDVKNG